MSPAFSITTDNQHARAVYLDMEWTCWDSPPTRGMQQEIIEIGMVTLDLNELRILDEASYFVRPRRWEISLKCTQLTGITHEDVRSASPLAGVLDAVSKRFEPKGIPCYTWGEDVSVLAKTCKSNGLISPLGRSIDLSLVFSRGLRYAGARRTEDSHGDSGNRVRWFRSWSASRREKHCPGSSITPAAITLRT